MKQKKFLSIVGFYLDYENHYALITDIKQITLILKQIKHSLSQSMIEPKLNFENDHFCCNLI